MSNLFSLVNLRALQFFFFAAIAFFLSTALLRGGLSSGTTYSLSFVDIDGNKLSTADGHVTVLVLATTADWEKARAVGDRVPDYCLGNPDYRMITIIRFIRKHGAIVRKIAMTVVKHRLTEEPQQHQSRYHTNKIMRDEPQDIFTVTDFDGTVSPQLSEPAGATDFCVFVFGRKGELLAQWHGVPSAKQLAAVVK
ncbi:MAG: hypothetical protein DMF73_19135 [Acidobacteria bacterium]|nr:MAG: hypothetical protein DMF73_19135 [Acidobacteriota bacterium]